MSCGGQLALPYDSLRRVAEPVFEAVSLFDAKEHLRIPLDVSDDDVQIMAWIAAARRMIESRIGSTLTLTQWQARLVGVGCGCSCGGVPLPMPPLVIDDAHPVEIFVRDGDGVKTWVDPSAYSVDDDRFPAVLRTRNGWPGVCCESSVYIRFWAGRRGAEEVPAQLRAALKMLVGHFYENREAVSTESGAVVLPLAVDALLASESWDGGY
jgi:uncharacterized phiE125 gp8 family phage protein